MAASSAAAGHRPRLTSRTPSAPSVPGPSRCAAQPLQSAEQRQERRPAGDPRPAARRARRRAGAPGTPARGCRRRRQAVGAAARGGLPRCAAGVHCRSRAEEVPPVARVHPVQREQHVEVGAVEVAGRTPARRTPRRPAAGSRASSGGTAPARRVGGDPAGGGRGNQGRRGRTRSGGGDRCLAWTRAHTPAAVARRRPSGTEAQPPSQRSRAGAGSGRCRPTSG